MQAALRILALTSCAAAPSSAFAGAWTEPQGQGQAIETLFGWGGAGAPYGGSASPSETKFETQTYFEYGLWDRLTLVGDIAAMRYELGAPTADRYFGFDYSGAGLRARVWSDDAWVVSVEATAYLSGARDQTRPAQDGNTGPEEDVRALLGRNLTLFGMPAFVDAEAGYRFRSEGPPGEWRGDVTLGIAWTPRTQVLFQTFNTVSNGAGAPGFLPWESHKGEVSLVYALDPRWSVQAGGFATLYRRNTNSEYGALLAVWRRF